MQRTQIYFEQSTLSDLKDIAKSLNISLSEFIRRSLKKEIKRYKKDSFDIFLDNLSPLESFSDVDASKYVEEIRSKSRLNRE